VGPRAGLIVLETRIIFCLHTHTHTHTRARARARTHAANHTQTHMSLRFRSHRIPAGARIAAPVQTGPGAHPASYTMGTGSFPGVKRPRRDVDNPPLSSAEVKEGVELYHYSPFGSSWPVIGWTLRYTLLYLWYVKPTYGAPCDGLRCEVSAFRSDRYSVARSLYLIIQLMRRLRVCHAVYVCWNMGDVAYTQQDSRAFPLCARKSSAWLTSARSNKMWQTKNGNVACWVFCFEILKDCACSWLELGWFWFRIPAWDRIFLGVIRSPHLSWTPENDRELRKENRLSESMKLSNVETGIHFVVFYIFHYITFCLVEGSW